MQWHDRPALKDMFQGTGGALVEAEPGNLPALDAVILIRLVSDVTEWVMRAKVVGVTTPQAPPRYSLRRKRETFMPQVRLSFLESCPYEFFKAAISAYLRQISKSNGTMTTARSLVSSASSFAGPQFLFFDQ